MQPLAETGNRDAVRLAGQYCPLCPEPGNGGARGSRVCAAGHSPVLLSWEWDSAEEYERRYASEDAEYHDAEMVRSGRPAFVKRDTEYLGTARRRLQKLREFLPRARTLLDVGSGTGSLVAQAEAGGWEAQGLEPCPALVAWGRSMGRRVTQGTWRDANGRYDVVTLCDVFEHLLEPREALRQLQECLNPGGVLYLEMPEYLAPYGDWKRHDKPLEHPVLYSAGAALQLFRECGLEWVALERPQGGELAKIAFLLRAAE